MLKKGLLGMVLVLALSGQSPLPPDFAIKRAILRTCQTTWQHAAEPRRGNLPGLSPPDEHSAAGVLVAMGDGLCRISANSDSKLADESSPSWLGIVADGLEKLP